MKLEGTKHGAAAIFSQSSNSFPVSRPSSDHRPSGNRRIAAPCAFSLVFMRRTYRFREYPMRFSRGTEEGPRFMIKKPIVLATACLVASLAQAAPIQSEQLLPGVTVQPSADLGISSNSMFNPRYFEGNIYANQINVPCFGRYPSGSSEPEMLVDNSFNIALEHRMVAPFRGGFSSIYLIASSSAAASTTTFTRYDYDGSNPVTVDAPDWLTIDAFDWVDEDTIIYAPYASGYRNRLYVADVVAEPFALTRNTSWNADGYATTSVSSRIRNVRTGDVFSGYAYYGDAGQNNNPGFYALNLATGAETLLGNAGTLTGGGSFGVWTVLERDGYLYVQTTDNGVQIYSMTDATTLGALYATHTKEQLDAVTGGSAQYFGLDVTADGKKWLLAGLEGKVYELLAQEGSPSLAISLSGENILLSWPASFSNLIVQATADLATGFADLDPQPAVVESDGTNTATIAILEGTDRTFFRLRQ